jgi:predicted aspartyl protease
MENKEIEVTGFLDERNNIYTFCEVINPITKMEAKEVRTIIDTGCSISMVRPDLVNGIGILSNSETEFINPKHGTYKAKTYLVDIRLNGLRWTGINCGEIIDYSTPCGFIIGMDLLKNCRWNYENGVFTMKISTNL